MGSLAKDQLCETIVIDTFNDLLASYKDIVPEKLHDLDEQRYNSIPAEVARLRQSDDARLTKLQVQTLVDWKLSHGTFRPSLKKLVSQNEENAVREVTDSVFAAWSEPEKNIKVSINTLSKLRGIGPATASLLLSIHDPEAVPFFSDELFRWLHWEDKPTKGWDRKIGYTIKEYLELFSKVDELRKRIQEESGRDVSATDAEKVAYVLGHQANQQSAGKEYEDAVKGMFEPESAGGDGNVKTTTAPEEPREEIEKARGKSAAKSGRKRRAGREAQSTSVEAPRRSKRTR